MGKLKNKEKGVMSKKMTEKYIESFRSNYKDLSTAKPVIDNAQIDLDQHIQQILAESTAKRSQQATVEYDQSELANDEDYQAQADEDDHATDGEEYEHNQVQDDEEYEIDK
jgi:hypothetical protein